jgi:hypothetical protein
MGDACGLAVYDHYAKLQDRGEDFERAINRTVGQERVSHHRQIEATLERAVLKGPN